MGNHQEEFVRPGLIGRSLRLLGGLVLGAGFAWALSLWRHVQDVDTMKLVVLFLVLLYALGDTFTKTWGLARRWRWLPHGTVVLLTIAAACVDLIRSESIPGGAVRAFVFALLLYELFVGTISFLLAALLAAPG